MLTAFVPSVNTEAASKVRLNRTSTTVYLNSSKQLKVYGTKKKVTWKSSNKKVAYVNSKGKVYGKKEGNATIYAKVNGKSYKCKVTVKYPLNIKSGTIYMGGEVQLKIRGIDGKVTWTSGNKNVLNVTSKGKVTAVNPGKASIYAKVNKKTYKCTFTAKEAVKIKKYKGLEIPKVVAEEVTDEYLNDYIQDELSYYVENVPVTDRPAQVGDTVVCSYTGLIDGQPFDEYYSTGTETEIEIGSEYNLIQLEQGLIGHSVGETFEVNVTFLEDDYADELTGKEAVYTVTIHSISAMPEITDAMIQTHKEDLGTDATTVAEYKAEVRETLEWTNNFSAETERETYLLEALLEESQVIRYPRVMLEDEKEEIKETYAYLAILSDMSLNQFIRETFGMSFDAYAKSLVKEELVVEYLSRHENITLSTKEYNTMLAEYAKQMGSDDSEMLEYAVGKAELKYYFLFKKVAKMLYTHCIETETAVTPE